MATVTNLPTELLRSLVAIVDTGSMQRATERIFVTQSALSLQIKRLEDLVQTPLFERTGRGLKLTGAGEILLRHARQILDANDLAVAALAGDARIGPVRVGLVQEFAETLLSGVLARFAELHPDAQLQVRVGGSAELTDLLQQDKLDIVLCVGDARAPRSIGRADMVWLGHPHLLREAVLPLAVLEEPCRFRDAAIAALDARRVPYRVVLETPSLSVLRAAVEAGLGVTCRTSSFLDRVLPSLEDAALPALPDVGYLLHVHPHAHPTIRNLADLIEATVVEQRATAPAPRLAIAARS